MTDARRGEAWGGAYGVMFHHFHGGSHPASQGSISGAQFRAILDFLGQSAHLIDADEWLRRAEQGTLEATDVCLTFDDSLKAQIDIAAPILMERGLRAFFFVYSSVLDGVPGTLELYRYVRNVCFQSLDAFYDEFEERTAISPGGARSMAALDGFDPSEHYQSYAFYSDRDRRYRYLRDSVMTRREHDAVMDEIVAAHIADRFELASMLWMTAADVRGLHERGHMIGLHSYSHPTTMARLTRVEQEHEYRRNKTDLERIIGSKVRTMSHPSNSYAMETLSLLSELGISLGFRDNMDAGYFGMLEAPRSDHMDVLGAVR